MKRSEKVSEPNEGIANILSVVRLLPPDIELRDVWSSYFQLEKDDPEKQFSALREAYGIDANEEWDDVELDEKSLNYYKRDKGLAKTEYMLEALSECLLNVPLEFLDYVDLPKPGLDAAYKRFLNSSIGGGMSYENFILTVANSLELIENLYSIHVTESVLRYEFGRKNHQRVYALMTFLTSWKKQGRRSHYYELNSKVFPITEVAISENRLIIVPDEFTAAFNGVDIDRLGLCGSCGRVFWLKRLDMKGCSLSCGKILRTRKWREKITPKQRLKYKINRVMKSTKQGEK